MPRPTDDPTWRRERARKAALTRWSRLDAEQRRAQTEALRRGFEDRFTQQARALVPDAFPDELHRRAKTLRALYLAGLRLMAARKAAGR
jgi:hypothetical protein